MTKLEGLQINPQKIHGKGWTGYALDFYRLFKPLKYTKIGNLVYQVKYLSDSSQIHPIAETAAKFINKGFVVKGRLILPDISKIIPIPHSDEDRPFQPVPKIAAKVGSILNLPVSDDLKKVKRTPRLQFILSVGNKRAAIHGAFEIKSQNLHGHCVLLIDDIYDSGSTLTEATKVLHEQGHVCHVFVLTLTKKIAKS